MKKLKYTHCAASNYVCDREYTLEQLSETMDIEDIKMRFTPTNFKWEDINAKPIKGGKRK